uniref:Beta-defensin-like domain-containing protein n=1 Tax=Gopherus evgoodei TaxID=1825980 RepID=A0A8C4W8D8_9SAUR
CSNLNILHAVLKMTLFLSAEFSKAQKLSKRCRLRGGYCSTGRCPPKTTRIGRCSPLRLFFCCQR